LSTTTARTTPSSVLLQASPATWQQGRSGRRRGVIVRRPEDGAGCTGTGRVRCQNNGPLAPAVAAAAGGWSGGRPAQARGRSPCMDGRTDHPASPPGRQSRLGLSERHRALSRLCPPAAVNPPPPQTSCEAMCAAIRYRVQLVERPERNTSPAAVLWQLSTVSHSCLPASPLANHCHLILASLVSGRRSSEPLPCPQLSRCYTIAASRASCLLGKATGC
jgi:hypothetical protein